MLEIRKAMALITVISFLITVINPPLYAQSEERKAFVAVLDLDVAKGIPVEAKISLSDLLREKLVNTGRFRVVDRNNMDKILKEQGFQLSDCTSQECAVQVGRMLGVEKMVTGNVTKLGQTYIITAQITNVETGEIEKMSSDRCAGCEVDSLLGSIDIVAVSLAGLQQTEKKPVQKAPEPGKLSVTSRPSQAQIQINGQDQGTTPSLITGLKPGQYEIRIQKQGFLEYVEKVTVDPGAAMSVDASLVSARVAAVPKPLPAAQEPAPQVGPEKKKGHAGLIVLIVLLSVVVVAGGVGGAVWLTSGGGDGGGGRSTVSISGPLP